MEETINKEPELEDGPENDGECCNFCKSWDRREDHENNACLRHAPKPLNGYKIDKMEKKVGGGNLWIMLLTEWPQTNWEDWCGEYQKRERPY